MDRMHGAASPSTNRMDPSETRPFPMGSLEISGSYPLTDAVIDEMLTQASPGNYALGYLDGDTFLVFYVGRSDSDLRHRLHEWVGAPSSSGRYAPSSRAAWGVHRRGVLPLDAVAQGRVAADADSGYTRFAYSYAPSADAAFAKEWRNYDDFGGSDGLDNAAPQCRHRVPHGERLDQETRNAARTSVFEREA